VRHDGSMHAGLVGGVPIKQGGRFLAALLDTEGIKKKPSSTTFSAGELGSSSEDANRSTLGTLQEKKGRVGKQKLHGGPKQGMVFSAVELVSDLIGQEKKRRVCRRGAGAVWEREEGTSSQEDSGSHSIAIYRQGAMKESVSLIHFENFGKKVMSPGQKVWYGLARPPKAMNI